MSTASKPNKHPDNPPVVTTPRGKMEGAWRPGSAAFLGIPFAEAPVGQLRFAPPVTAMPWDGLRRANAYGSTPQRRPFGPIIGIPEPTILGPSTLNVNVFTPAPGDRDARLPVLVWIHGGGYFAGSPASPWYDGGSFNRNGVVTVSLSYRLGFDGFGWMAGSPLNRGILDQIAGLEWVRENIRDFGGDPDAVTLGGQSAGGGSVLALLASPASDGLFRSAIVQSGASGTADADGAEVVGRKFASFMNINPTRKAWQHFTEDQILDHERVFNSSVDPLAPSYSSAALIQRARTQGLSSVDLTFTPVVDGESVNAIDTMIAEGRTNQLPLLLGTTRNEMSFASDTDLASVVGELRAAGIDDAGIDRYSREVNRTGLVFARSQLATSQVFRSPAISIAAMRADAGADGNTWLYDFDYRSRLDGVAGHCYDLPFTWNNLHAEKARDQFSGGAAHAVAGSMHASWVEFITSGAVGWKSVDTSPVGAQVFGAEIYFDEAAYAFDAQLAGLNDTGKQR